MAQELAHSDLSAGYSVLLEIPYQPATEKRYFELDWSLSLTDNLKAKTFIEFPELLLVSKGNLGRYRLVNPGDPIDLAQNRFVSSRFYPSVPS